ncbi:MAG: hypothetical protein IPO37_01085 [Saprospiraceae bacterium]|nr:hypothetical protein [Saprospiraceae bacterium]
MVNHFQILCFWKGKLFQELIGVTIANQDFRLSNLRGNMYYLDFGSVGRIPLSELQLLTMKTFNKNYKEYNNFEIVSIAFDDNKLYWLKAVEKIK